MVNKKVEGYWICSHCGTKDIGGLTKTCPNCGQPQAKGLKFYVKSGTKKYLDSEISENYGKGADWVCPYCGSYNRYNAINCKNCGAEKASAEIDYFGKPVKINTENTNENPNSGEHIIINETFQPETYEVKELQSPCNKDESSDRLYNIKNNHDKNTSAYSTFQSFLKNINLSDVLGLFGIGITLITVIMLLISIFTPKTFDAWVSDKTWSRSINIQELRTLKESDWSVPYGGRIYDEKQEIRDYDHIVDHYDTIEHQESKEEFDYYEYSYIDNGDGTFDEIKEPIYKTVYYKTYETVPVYVDIPIYDTKYYYEIDRWCYDRTEKATGNLDNPYWPEFSLDHNEREAEKSEKYTIYFETRKEKTYSINVSYQEWLEYNMNEEYNITVVAGIVTKIEP